jgi:hypothetical protein
MSLTRPCRSPVRQGYHVTLDEIPYSIMPTGIAAEFIVIHDGCSFPGSQNGIYIVTLSRADFVCQSFGNRKND